MPTPDPVISSAEIAAIEWIHANTRLNAEASDGLIRVPDLDFDNLPPHYRLSGPTTEKARRVSSTGPTTLRNLGSSALLTFGGMLDKRFEEFLGSDRRLELDEATDSIAADMANGKDATLALGHGKFKDLPIPQTIISAELTRRGVKHQTALIVAKGLDYAEIDLSSIGLNKPVVDAMLRPIGLSTRKNGNLSMRAFFRLFANQTLFTIPDTESFAPLREDEEQKIIVDNFTRAMFRRLLTLRKESDVPIILSIAAPGTTNKLLDVEAYDKDKKYDTLPAEFTITDTPIEVIGTPPQVLSSFFSNTQLYIGATKLQDGEPLDISITPSAQDIDIKKEGDYRRFLEILYERHSVLFDQCVINLGSDPALPTIRR